MALNLGPSIILSGSYNTQSSRLNFEGLTYTLVGSTFTVSQITQNGGTAFLSLTGIQAGTYASLIVGNYIVGPGIPACSQIIAVVSANSGAGTGTYRMSCAQPVGLSSVAGCSAATGVYTNYGQVVASAPSYTTGSQRGQLEFYAPTASKPTVPTMILTNGNVGIGYGKTMPLSALDVSGTMTVLNGNVGIGTSNPQATLDISGTLNVSARKPTWYITTSTAGSGANASTPLNKIIGSTDNSPSTVRFDSVTTYGGATASDWNTSTAIFTASKAGTYYFQLNVFINSFVSGRWLACAGTCVEGSTNGGTYQYLMFDTAYLTTSGATEGAFSVNVMYYMDVGQTFYYYTHMAASPTLFYGKWHTCLQIIKML